MTIEEQKERGRCTDPLPAFMAGLVCGLAGNACWSRGWDKVTSAERDVAERVCEIDRQCGQGGRKSAVGIQMERLHETGDCFLKRGGSREGFQLTYLFP